MLLLISEHVTGKGNNIQFFVYLAFHEINQEHCSDKLLQESRCKEFITKSVPSLLYTNDILKNSDNVKVYQSPVLLENRKQSLQRFMISKLGYHKDLYFLIT